MASSDRRAPNKKPSSRKTAWKIQFLKESKVVKICQGDLLGVTALKRSTKGAMNSSFCNAPYTKPSTSKATTKM